MKCDMSCRVINLKKQILKSINRGTNLEKEKRFVFITAPMCTLKDLTNFNHYRLVKQCIKQSFTNN